MDFSALKDLSADAREALLKLLQRPAGIPDKYLEGSTRQLQDLRKRPSVATINGQITADERPYFDLGEVPDAYPGKGTIPPFRVLRWNRQTGVEVVARSHDELMALGPDYCDYPELCAIRANLPKVDPVTELRDELSALSPEERESVLKAQRDARLAKLQDRLAALSEEDLAAASKRNPGRPPAAKTA